MLLAVSSVDHDANWLLTLLFVGTAAVFLISTYANLFHLRWAHRLPKLDSLAADTRSERSSQNSILCTAVIAARDEADRIADSVRHLLSQTGVQIDAIVVDDRSSDGTDEIVRRLAIQDPRLQWIRVETLPDGWIGKCHACHLGAKAATGDWILFMDADCWLGPDVIARALQAAERDQADHITLTPGVVPETQSARAWHLVLLTSLASWLSGVNRDRPRAYVGIGAFNLVRADAYRQSGGYEALRLTVVDDVGLGLLLRRAGKRTRGFLGGTDACCHWGTTVPSMIKIMEKNYFALLHFNLGLALLAGIGGISLWCVAVLAPLSGTIAGVIAGLSVLTPMIPAAIVARRIGWPLTSIVLTPLVFPAILYAVLNSTFVTVRQGGIYWRETFYPLEILRKGNVR